MRIGAILAFLAAACLSGCGDGSKPPAPNPTPTPAPSPAPDPSPSPTGYRVVEVKTGGSLSVKIYYKGRVPKSKISATDPCCVDSKTDNVVVNADKLLRDAVVYLDIHEGKDFTDAPLPVIDQKGCIFSPHVSLCRPGKGVIFRNSDPVLHNIHVLPFSNRELNQSVQQNGEFAYVPQFPEFIPVKCDVHTWMNVHLVAMDHPYYATTGMDGTAEISGIPAGSYKAKFWHPYLGSLSAEVKIVAGSKTEITAEFPEKQD